MLLLDLINKKSACSCWDFHSRGGSGSSIYGILDIKAKTLTNLISNDKVD